MLVDSILRETAQLKEYSASYAETWLQPKGLTQRQRDPLRFRAMVRRSALPVIEGSTATRLVWTLHNQTGRTAVPCAVAHWPKTRK
jgi:hypothetical protein